MTLAAQIMKLHASGRSTREIALAVYGEAGKSRMAYVRVVARQRKGKGASDIDKRYCRSAHGRKALRTYRRNRYWSDGEYRERSIARATKWNRENPEKLRASRRRYWHKRWQADPAFRAKHLERAKKRRARERAEGRMPVPSAARSHATKEARG